jgi:hypothetical protein
MTACVVLLASTAGAQSATLEPWSFSVSANAWYEDNVQLTQNGTGTSASSVAASLGRDWGVGRGRGNVSLSGNVNETFYHEAPELNQFMYGAAFNTAYAISRRLSWSLNDSVNQSYAQDAKVLTDQGIVLPKVLAFTNSVSNNFTYLLSPQSQLSWGVAAQVALFPSSSFVNGTTVSNRLGYSHEVGRSQRIGITHEYQRSFVGESDQINQALLGTWQRPIGKDSGLSVGIGVRFYTLPPRGYTATPTGSVSLSTHVRRSDTLALTYEQTVQQVFALGRTLQSHIVTASYGLILTTKLGADFSATYAQSASPLATEAKLIGETGNVSLHYTIVKKLSASGGYAHYLRQDEPAPSVRSYRSYAALTYGLSWR